MSHQSFDIRHQLEILALLASLPCTLIVTLHDLTLAASMAERVLLIHNGEQQACCSAENVLTQERIKQNFAVESLIDQHPISASPRFTFTFKP